MLPKDWISGSIPISKEEKELVEKAAEQYKEDLIDVIRSTKLKRLFIVKALNTASKLICEMSKEGESNGET